MRNQLVAETTTYTTHNKQKRTNIHVLRGIRIGDRSNEAAADRTVIWNGTVTILFLNLIEENYRRKNNISPKYYITTSNRN
jgi:hypothetical protein